MEKNREQFEKEREEIVNRLKMSDIVKITHNKVTGELLAYKRSGRSDIFGSRKSLKPMSPDQLAQIYKISLK